MTNAEKNMTVNQLEYRFIALITFVAVSDRVEIHVVILITKEHKTEPRIKRVNGNDEEDAHDPALLIGARVEAEEEIDLQEARRRIT